MTYFTPEESSPREATLLAIRIIARRNRAARNLYYVSKYDIN